DNNKVPVERDRRVSQHTALYGAVVSRPELWIHQQAGCGSLGIVHKAVRGFRPIWRPDSKLAVVQTAPCWRGCSPTEVEGAGGDPLGRPTGQVQPAVGAHEEHTYGRLVTDSVGHAFEPVVEPAQAQRVQVNRRLRTKVQLSSPSRA